MSFIGTIYCVKILVLQCYEKTFQYYLYERTLQTTFLVVVIVLIKLPHYAVESHVQIILVHH